MKKCIPATTTPKENDIFWGERASFSVVSRVFSVTTSDPDSSSFSFCFWWRLLLEDVPERSASPSSFPSLSLFLASSRFVLFLWAGTPWEFDKTRLCKQDVHHTTYGQTIPLVVPLNFPIVGSLPSTNWLVIPTSFSEGKMEKKLFWFFFFFGKMLVGAYKSRFQLTASSRVKLFMNPYSLSEILRPTSVIMWPQPAPQKYSLNVCNGNLEWVKVHIRIIFWTQFISLSKRITTENPKRNASSFFLFIF